MFSSSPQASPVETTTTTGTSSSFQAPLHYTTQQSQNTSFPPRQQQQQNQRHNSGTASVSDNRSVYSSATRKSIVFVTPAKYTTLVWCLLSIPLLAIVISIFILHPSRTDYRDSSTAWILGWILLLVLVLYMALLPKQIDVRSTGTVGIKTFLLTFHIDGIVRAYHQITGLDRQEEDSFLLSSSLLLRPRIIRFGTSHQERVILRRNHGKWDVVVSPENVEGFLLAVEEMVREHDNNNNKIGGGGGEEQPIPLDVENNIILVPTNRWAGEKPDLASTDYQQFDPQLPRII
jgi:hypothetical protein